MAAAVEFALVGSLFVLMTLFIFVAGAILYIGEVVDYATNAATRDIMTGAAQANAVNQQTFTQSLCNRLPARLPCSNLINLYTVTKAAAPGGYNSYVKADQSKLTIPALTPGGRTVQPRESGRLSVPPGDLPADLLTLGLCGHAERRCYFQR